MKKPAPKKNGSTPKADKTKGGCAATAGYVADRALEIAIAGVAKTRGKNRSGQHHTPRLQQTMTRAAIEADKLGATYIGTEHVLLAMLALEQGSAWRMLMASGMTYESTKFALRVQQCS